jgi:isoleucyl-tRNA synthetase
LQDRSLDLEFLKSVSNNKIESAFDKIKEISSMSFSLRNKLKLKRRWPLESIFVFSQDVEFLGMEGMLDLLREQMNIENIIVKKVRWTDKAAKLVDMIRNNAPVIPNLTVNRKTVAKELKGDIMLFIEKFDKLDKNFVLDQLQESGSLDLEYSEGKSFKLTLEDVNIDFDTTNGYSALERDNLILFLNTHRNDELIIKGMVKDLARNIQQLRKELGYSPTKILDTAYISNFSEDEISKIQKFEDVLRNLVRVNKIVFPDRISNGGIKPKQVEIDGRDISIYIQ